MDAYYSRNEVSNSDLSALQDYLLCRDTFSFDKERAYAMGSLIDAIITEPHKVDFYRYKVAGTQYSKEDFELAMEMRKSFQRDALAASILKASETQKVFVNDASLQWGDYHFSLRMRCKFDLWMNRLGFGGDLKSTTATTQLQFEDAIRHFDYDRQRAVYMTLSGSQKDVLIGVSKKNFKVFKVFITRDSELFKSGMEKFTDLAFKWHILFS